MARVYVGKTLQLSSEHPEILDYSRSLMPMLVREEADRRGLTMIGDPTEARVEYGRMEPTGEMIEFEGELIPETYWMPTTEEDSVYVLLTWEAPALEV